MTGARKPRNATSESMSTRKTGRPSAFTQALGDRICQKITEGLSLRKICKLEGIPSTTSVFRWLDANPAFREQYALSKQAQAEHYANEIVEIADERPTCMVPDPDGGVSERVDNAGVNRNRLRVDARKWVAAKLLPKKYGEFRQVEHSGTITLETLITGGDD